MTYNPYHALRDEHPEITLAVLRLPAGQAWWLPEDEGIVLDNRLSQAERRSALSHELEHVRAGDTYCDQAIRGAGRIGRRQELAADSGAAKRLITLDELADAFIWCLGYVEVAEYLHVDQRTVRARVLNLTPAEKAYIERHLATKEASA